MKRALAIAIPLLLISCIVILYVFRNEAPTTETGKRVLRIALWQDSTNAVDAEVIDAFKESNPNVDVEIISLPASDYASSLQALISGQQMVDICFIQNHLQLSKLIQKQILKPLDFLLSQSALSDACLDGVETLRSPIDNALYALPYKSKRYYLYYNRDLFDFVDMHYPSNDISWDEFIQIGEELSKRFRQTGMEDVYSILLLPNMIELSEIGIFDTKTLIDGNGVIPASFLALTDRLCKSDALFPFFDCYEKNCCKQTFETGTIAMFVTDNDFLYTLVQDRRQNKFNFDFGVVKQPCIQNSDLLTSTIPVAIYRYTQNTDLAWEFISFLCGDKGADILSKNMLIPSYHNESVEKSLSKMAVASGISCDLFAVSADSFTFCCPTEVQSLLIERCYGYIEDYILGLNSQAQCLYMLQSESYG